MRREFRQAKLKRGRPGQIFNAENKYSLIANRAVAHPETILQNRLAFFVALLRRKSQRPSKILAEESSSKQPSAPAAAINCGSPQVAIKLTFKSPISHLLLKC